MLSLRIIDNEKYGIKSDPLRHAFDQLEKPDSDYLAGYGEKNLNYHSQISEQNKISFRCNDYMMPSLST